MNVSWKKYINPKNKDTMDLFKRNDFEITHQTYVRLKRGYQQRKSHIILFEFEDSEIVSVVKRDEYLDALKRLFQVCLEIEYYEICGDLNTIILQDVSQNRVSNSLVVS